MSLGPSRPAMLAACAFFGLTVGCGTGRVEQARQTAPEHSRESIEALARLLGPQRFFQPRVSGGFLHAPLSLAPSKSLPQLRDPRFSARLRIEAEIERAAEEHPSASSFGARGVLRLVQGRVSSAVDDLRTATSLEPDQPRYWSDLSAAFQVSAVEGGEASEWLSALGAAEIAVGLDPQFPEALFNRALVLQQWSVVEKAAADWKLYLEQDSESGWAAEARRRLRDLEESRNDRTVTTDKLFRAAKSGDLGLVEEACRQSPQEAREMAEDELLPAWAEAIVQGRRADARRQLDTIGRFGKALASSSGERMVEDSAANIEALSSSELRRLADGFLDYRMGRSLYDQGRLAEAEQALQRAHRLLRAVGSPFALWARFHLSLCAYQRAEYETVLSDLKAILPAADYPSLRARVHRTVGLVHLLLGDHGRGLRHNRQALEIYRAMGEAENVAQICASLAENLVLLGRRREAWNYYRQGLQLSRANGNLILRRALFTLAARAAHDEGHDEEALLFQSEAARWASLSSRAQDAAGALAASAWLKIRLGRFSSAAADLSAAQEQIDRIPDESIRTSYRLDTALLEAEILLKDDPRRALAAVEQAIQGFREQSLNVRMAQSYRLRSRIQSALNQPDRAEEDLSIALNWIEKFREGLAERSSIPFADDSRLYYDDMIELQVSRGDAAAAFETSERARARALVERIRGIPVRQWESSPPEEGILSRLRKSLNRDTVVVAYRVLNDKTLIWTVAREEIELTPVPIPSGRLDRQVERLLADSRDEELFKDGAAALYETLIAPVDDRVKRFPSVVLILDRSLHRVPFAGLWDSREKTYLIERHRISIAPGAGLIVETTERGQSALSRPRERSVLIVADPEFDRSLNPMLAPLPGSRREAEEVSRVWGHQSKLLQGAAATPAAFFAAAQGKAILHIAAHALANAEMPDRSALLLARDEEKNGVLTVRQLYERDFSGTQLVILSACRSSAGAISQSEGSLSLARPFLAGGAAAVVASLWPVEDRSAARLFAAFHRSYRLRPDAAAALREAQLESLRGTARNRSPRLWSGFQAVGGLLRDASWPKTIQN